LVEKSARKLPLKNPDVNRRIILKCILRELGSSE
jgi:hypothetical protein